MNRHKVRLEAFNQRLKRASEYASIYGNHPVNSFVENELEKLWKSLDDLEQDINDRLESLERLFSEGMEK